MTGFPDRLRDGSFGPAYDRLCPAFEVLGRLPYDQLLGKYSGVRGLILPSIWEEPLSYAVAESMAAGTIPIASDVGGNREIVKGSVAEQYLFNPFESGSLAQMIRAILSLSEGELLSIGENLRQCILETMREEETTERFVRFFEN
jgi:glycosyltransferase involved in cell wall biosynthesis